MPPGIDEDVITFISRKKHEPQFMLDWRLKAFRHWQTMREPDWAHLRIAPIDYQGISYYSAPKAKLHAFAAMTWPKASRQKSCFRSKT